MQKKERTKDFIKYGELKERVYGWQDALPLGNGVVGALCKMGARREEVSFLLDGAVIGGEVGVLPDVSDKMKDVRTLIDGSNPVVAGATIENALKNKKYNPKLDSQIINGKFFIKFLNAKKITGFTKEIKFNQEEAVASYNLGESKIIRRCFVSHKDNQFYYEVSASSKIDMELGVCGGSNAEILEHNVKDYNENSDQSINMVFYEKSFNGMSYGIAARVLVDNSAVLVVENGLLRVENAEKMLVVICPYQAKTREKYLDKIKRDLLALRQVSYEKSFKEHLDEYLKKWGRQEISVSGLKDDLCEKKLSTDLHWVVERLFYMAKYLMVNGFNEKQIQYFSCGLWNNGQGGLNSVCDTILSLPCMYSAFLPFGEEEKFAAFKNYLFKHLDDTKKIANRLYKSVGFEMPAYFVLGSLLPGKIDAANLSSICGGAIIANLMFEYFLYTKDVKFLKTEALPFMCGVADFYLNYFKPNAAGVLESVPSKSPFGKVKAFQYKDGLPEKNAVADFVVVKALLVNIINANNVYSMPVAKIIDYQNFLNKLSIKFLTNGEIREYIGLDASENSGGVVQLYPVYNSLDINLYSSPEVISKTIMYLKQKLDKNISAFNILALTKILDSLCVLGQREIFYELLRFMVDNYLAHNMLFLDKDKFDLDFSCPGGNGFNIAANMQVASTIIRTFAYENGNDIYVLPCKIWSMERGSISGIYTKNNVIMDIVFDDKKGSMQITFKAVRAAKFNIVLFKGVKKVKGHNVDPLNPKINNISIAAGKSLVLDIKY